MINYRFITKLAALILIVSTLFTFCSCGKGTGIKSSIDVTFSGPENHAKPVFDIDYDSINGKINAKKVNKYLSGLSKKASKGMDELEAAFNSYDYYSGGEYFQTLFDVSFAEEYTELKNGDEVTVEIKPSGLMERSGQTLKDIKRGTGISVPEKIKFKVEGLEEATEIDIFADTSKIVEFSGANNHGKASVNIAEDFSITAGNIEIIRDSYYENKLIVKNGDSRLGYLSVSLDNNESLKKGDVITVTAATENSNGSVISGLLENGYVLKSESIQITVPDLGDANEYDILSKFESYIKLKGANGYGVAEIFIPENTEFALGNVYFKRSGVRSFNVVYDNTDYGSMYFTLTAPDNLKKGDKISVTIEEGNTVRALEEKGLYAKDSTMEYTVPDLGEFINSVADLSKEDIAKIKQIALKHAAEKRGEDIKFEGIWFGTIKDNAAHTYNAKGFVSVIYSYHDFFGTEYAGIDYYDISKNPEGNLNLETTKDFGSWGFNYDGTSDSFNQNYNYTKIG